MQITAITGIPQCIRPYCKRQPINTMLAARSNENPRVVQGKPDRFTIGTEIPVSGIPLPHIHRFSTTRLQKKVEENRGPDAVEMLPPDADGNPVEMPKPKGTRASPG
jgi:hypothetical protein